MAGSASASEVNPQAAAPADAPYTVVDGNKVDPKTHFRTVRSANHEANLLAVVNKQVDVATNNDNVT